ncbi:cobalamin biosynthesis protein [Nitrososphaera sp.]|uniref:cobalt-precorrin 5A hydrolase n=1 Tax=Nitrososphaera sp. TaxID=1971748 RepID=UPI00182A7B3A|nr:cobalamin biosynthesis protein [Nitrososphaera sp.]NWG36052.1 cobalamin biosynthesis protein [Nitrososphaera sp.]
MARTAIVAITKHGIDIARKIKARMPEVEIYVPAKHSDGGTDINWFSDQSTQLVGSLFKTHDALVCIFSLGAVIRMVAPHLVDKKSDPAVVVIDDRANHVISALSGHLGGANALARLLASILGAAPVITTAADVNETIAVDLVGREYGWTIENFENVTRTSALMVNEERIAVYQDAGEKGWWHEPLPKNVEMVGSLEKVLSPEFKAGLVITDRVVPADVAAKSVVYRPKTLVVGIGLHFDTDSNTIESGVTDVFAQNGLALFSIRNVASVNRGARVKGLDEFAQKHGLAVEIFEKAELAKVEVPNPSAAVQKFEGTASVSEAASLLSSNGELVVQKVKFPPNLTVAVCRVKS